MGSVIIPMDCLFREDNNVDMYPSICVRLERDFTRLHLFTIRLARLGTCVAEEVPRASPHMPDRGYLEAERVNL
jgi:hypothetical protein